MDMKFIIARKAALSNYMLCCRGICSSAALMKWMSKLFHLYLQRNNLVLSENWFDFDTFATMECVGCEKCRLWGKLQVLGLETALKILFSVDGVYRHDQHGIIVWARTSLSALASFSLRSNLNNAGDQI
ncbi:uncharacterized protein LOC107870172 [Capsicum annuum]|uniref:uncharacterized protein LOC107870172 n=1 Tax=Capsicum annuum TaxID=4072 RepID=UPI001FB0A12E|nr:uncharacterized protein LOC107870172 [Capsicum annuum]